jgi:hypothetical protein
MRPNDNDTPEQESPPVVQNKRPLSQPPLDPSARPAGKPPVAGPPAASAKADPTAYQMMWDCKFCGTQKLLGITDKFCPNCGANQDPLWRYFPSDADKKAVSDPNYKYAGVDKICTFCQTPNSANGNFCKQCGGDLAEAASAKVRGKVLAGSEADKGVVDDHALEKFKKEQAAIAPQGNKGGIPIWLIGLAVLFIGGIIGFISLSNSTYKAKLEVTEMAWQRVITVEQLQTLAKSDWREDVPGDAYDRTCNTRDRTFTRSEEYQCGTEKIDRGDGSFVEQPKYCSRQVEYTKPDSFCAYKVDRWIYVRDIETKGGPNDPVQWGVFTPTRTTREGGRLESYKVGFKGLAESANKKFTYETSKESAWRRFSVGRSYEVDINRLEQVQWETLKDLAR